jgi:hypothetical protein
MTATIIRIVFTDATTGAVVPNPRPDDSQAVGDVSILTLIAPHLLKQTIVRSHLSPSDVEGGNPYWCGEGLDSHTRTSFCNA